MAIRPGLNNFREVLCILPSEMLTFQHLVSGKSEDYPAFNFRASYSKLHKSVSLIGPNKPNKASVPNLDDAKMLKLIS